MYITIEGNIGAGKSTLLTELADYLNYTRVEEGIETDETFQRLLKEDYQGVENANEALNLYLAQYRSNIIASFAQGNYLMERSVLSSYLFAQIDGSSEQTVTAIKQTLDQGRQPDFYIYIHTPAATCLERVKQRGRDGEELITLEYLQQVESIHESWANQTCPSSILRLDGTKTLDAQAIAQHITQRLSPLETVNAR